MQIRTKLPQRSIGTTQLQHAPDPDSVPVFRRVKAGTGSGEISLWPDATNATRCAVFRRPAVDLAQRNAPPMLNELLTG